MKKESPSKRRTVKSFLLDLLKGITLGISAAVPGLSGGTVAVAEGCYDGLIQSAGSLRQKFKESFLFLLPYLLGLGLGALAAFAGIKKGYALAPFTLTGLFAGMVAGSLPVALSELKKGENGKQKLLYALCFSFCFLIAAGLGIVTALCKIDLASFLQERVWWMYLFVPLAGFVAAFCFVIPGISGSMSLMVMGMYYPILFTFLPAGSHANDVEKALTIWGSSDGGFVGTGIVLLLLLTLGAVLGLVVSSKTMAKLLESKRVPTFYGIFGLILGSLVSMFINSDIYPKYISGGVESWDYIVGAALFLVGGVAIFLLIRFVDKKQAKKVE